MKGQFFLIVALSLTLLYFVGMVPYLSPPSITEGDYSKNLLQIFTNIYDEYPRVLNFGINESAATGHLSNFTLFAKTFVKDKGLSLEAFWLVAENSSDDVNVTVGNYLGRPQNVTLNISSETHYVYLENNSTGYVVFSSPPAQFNITVTFNSRQSQISLEKYKTSIYFFLSMSNGENVMKGEGKA